jgi:plastocyanin
MASHPVSITKDGMGRCVFSPYNLTIAYGEEVIWTNQDVDFHRVTFDKGTEPCGTLPPDEQCSFIPENRPGTVIDYNCGIPGHTSVPAKITIT